MQRRQLLVAGAVLLSGCTAEGIEATSNGKNEDKPKLEIKNAKLVDDIGLATVRADVKNVSDEELSYVQLKAFIFNDAGERLSDSIDNASDVPPGQTVKMEVPFGVEYEKVADYKCEASTSL